MHWSQPNPIDSIPRLPSKSGLRDGHWRETQPAPPRKMTYLGFAGYGDTVVSFGGVEDVGGQSLGVITVEGLG